MSQDNFFTELLKATPKDENLYTTHSMDIAYLIRNYIENHSIEKQYLAEKLGKNPSEISKWLSGNHNFTISTISKIEAETGLEIIKILTNEEINVPNRLPSKKGITIQMEPTRHSNQFTLKDDKHEYAMKYGGY